MATDQRSVDLTDRQWASRQTIVQTVDDLALELLDYGRRTDEDLPLGAIEEAIDDGVITVAEIMSFFAASFESWRRKPYLVTPRVAGEGGHNG